MIAPVSYLYWIDHISPPDIRLTGGNGAHSKSETGGPSAWLVTRLGIEVRPTVGRLLRAGRSEFVFLHGDRPRGIDEVTLWINLLEGNPLLRGLDRVIDRDNRLTVTGKGSASFEQVLA